MFLNRPGSTSEGERDCPNVLNRRSKWEIVQWNKATGEEEGTGHIAETGDNDGIGRKQLFPGGGSG